jgi:uncharacterized glyoxalase superfamily protein PhnB
MSRLGNPEGKIAMKPTPANFPRITSGLTYRDAAGMIDWLCAAFGFAVRLKVLGEDGSIRHSELTYGDGVIMIGGEEFGAQARWGVDRRSPHSIGGCNTQGVMVYVDDVEAHCTQARAHGATIVDEVATHDYGDEYWADRSYGALDPEGHMWWFTQRVRG